jgi:hypothetical protein
VKVSRNDPCPCGSGRKYKKCCLREDARRAAPDPRQERDDLRATAFAPLLRFANRPQFRDARDAAHDLFGADEIEDLGDGEEPVDEDVQLKFCCYYVFDHRLPDGRTVAETFLERAGWQVGARERALLQRFGAARLRPYEVEEVRADEGLRLRDLWHENEVFVAERAGTHQLTRWDLVAARVAPDEDGTLRLEGGIYLLPARLKQRLLDALHAHAELLRKIGPAFDEDLFFRTAAPFIHRFWVAHVVHRTLPTLVTAEGDLMEFGKVVFDVADRETLVAALNRHPDLVEEDGGGWTWFEKSDDDLSRSLGRLRFEDDRLVLEVTSRARAERGRRLLAEAASGALRHRSSRYEDVREAIARRAGAAEEDPPSSIDPDEAAALILEYKQRHYRTWPDEALPALDGRTPRQAAGSERLRPRLIDLLKEIENSEVRAARPASPAYDFGWMWQELGLQRPT